MDVLLRSAFENLYYEIHAIYGPGEECPEEPDWYCAAVDLFEPGLTFKVYFTREGEKAQVQQIQRWIFG